jgi:hypothetical protein
MDWKSDMVMMKGGEMIMMINGDMLRMETDVYTADGTMVRPDGTLIFTDGTTRVLIEDEAMIIDMSLTRTEEM